jgi:hypothetical protein
LSSSSSRDRLTTSELHPPRSPPRLFPRLLHRSAQFTSLHERSPRPPIGVHPQQTAASTSGYLPIRRPRFQQLRIDHASRFSEKLLRPFSSRTISRTSVRRTRTQAASIPIKGGLFSFPSVRTDPLVLELFQFPRGLPGSPSIPRLFVIRFATRDRQHTSSGGLSGLFLDAQRPTSHVGDGHAASAPVAFSHVPFTDLSPSVRFSFGPLRLSGFRARHTMWLGITTVRRQPATASSCLALRRCLRIRTTHTPCPPSIEHSELAG